jgi:hypothetical protein
MATTTEPRRGGIWVFAYFAQSKGQEALWSLATVLAGAVMYHFYIRKQGPAEG